MELAPGDDSGGGASNAVMGNETERLAMTGIDICGTIHTSNGRVAEYMGAGLTAVLRCCPWQQE